MAIEDAQVKIQYGDRDTLIGSRGNDLLGGGEGLDILNGTDNVSFGVNERDTLTGGHGNPRPL